MGQQLSAHQDDASCFRACLRDKNNKNLKTQAAPISSTQTHFSPINKNKIHKQHNIVQQHNTNPLPAKLDTHHFRQTETSLDLRWQTQTKPHTEVKGKLGEQQKQTVVKQKEHKNQQQVVALGLQSKFSSSCKSKTKVLTKKCKGSEGGITRCISQKQICNSEETSTKSQQNTTSHTKSRKVLLNKIEDIKQKYFQRELEIEIYQDQNDYQQQLDQLAKIEEKCMSEHNQLPLASVREITYIKKNIIQKLNQRKIMRNKKVLQKNVKEDQDGDNQDQKNQLQLYSRHNIKQTQQELIESKKEEDQLKSSKIIMKKQKLNKPLRSVDSSLQVSIQQRIQFSVDSQQDTLQQIRQCDQEQQDYKSKLQSKMKQVLKGIHSKRLNNKNSNVQNIKQSSEVVNQINNRIFQSKQAKELQAGRKSGTLKMRASITAKSIKGVDQQKMDNKILLF